MLLQFSVKNYKSIKDKAVLSLEAGTNKELVENYAVMENGDRILKGAVIFGANAGGKSNIFLALTSALLAVRRSVYNLPGTPLWPFTPFSFSEETQNAPTEFEFVFTYKEVKYIYGFAATSFKVEEEHLYAYKTPRPSTVFQREGDDYYFPESIKSKMMPLVERNLPNKLFISTSASWNCPYTVEPMEWLLNGIDTYNTQYRDTMPRASEMYTQDTDGSLKCFTEKLLKEADINISDFNLETEENTPERIAQEQHMPEGLKNLLFSGLNTDTKVNSLRCEMFHDVTDNGNSRRYKLDFEEESLGTKNLFMFAPFIKKALDEGLTIFVDEFDSSLHPLLLEYIVSLFMNPETNKSNAQLVISSHSMELMNLDIFRRDQIYFIDKDRVTGASSLYSLDEFSIRPTFSKLRENYLCGRFNAVPRIGRVENV